MLSAGPAPPISLGIPTEGRGGVETYKRLDITGKVSASHQRDLPRVPPGASGQEGGETVMEAGKGQA